MSGLTGVSVFGRVVNVYRSNDDSNASSNDIALTSIYYFNQLSQHRPGARIASPADIDGVAALTCEGRMMTLARDDLHFSVTSTSSDVYRSCSDPWFGLPNNLFSRAR